MAITADHHLGTGAVIGEEEDDGILKGIHGPEFLDDPAHLDVDPFDHCRMKAHLHFLEFLLLFGKRIPWNRAVDFAVSQNLELLRVSVRRTEIALHGREFPLDQSHLLYAFPALAADHFPANPVPISHPFDILRQRLQGKMGRGKCNE